MGRVLVFRGQPSFPALSNFGVPFYLCILYCRTTKFDLLRHVGRWVYLGASHASHPKRSEFQRSPFWGSPVFMRIPFNAEDQIRHSNTYGEGRVILATPLYLHKCVARFVSDSCVSCLVIALTKVGRSRKHSNGAPVVNSNAVVSKISVCSLCILANTDHIHHVNPRGIGACS